MEAAAVPARARKSRKPFVILGIIAALVAGGWFLRGYLNRGKVTTDDAQVDADVVPIAPRVGGTILRVAQGDQPVKAGDVLVELDPADLDARVRQAEADLAAALAQADAADAQVSIVVASSKGGRDVAQAQLSGSAVGVRSADAQVAAAEAALARARADLADAESDAARQEKLFAQGAVPRAMRDDAVARRDSARAGVAQAQAQVSAAREARQAARAHVAESQARLDQSTPIDAQQKAANAAAALAHAKVDAARASLEIAKLQRSYTTIVAPADGVVSRFAAHTGQVVQPGQVLCEFVPTATYVVANFKETQLARITPGQRAEVSIDALPGQHFRGHVASLSAATGARFSLLPPDNASGNFVKVVQRVPVRIDWDEPLPAGVTLRAGLSAEVTIRVD